jgi:hypothetical protein
MSNSKKLLALGVLAVLAGAGLYQARQAVRLRADLAALQQQQAQGTARLQQVQRERDDATNRLAVMAQEVARLTAGQNTSEVLKLRGQVSLLQRQLAVLKEEAASDGASFPKLLKDPAMRDYIRQSQMNFIRWNFGSLFKDLKLSSDQVDQSVRLLSEVFMRQGDKMYAAPQGSLTPAQIEQAKAAWTADLNQTLAPIWGDAGCAKFKQFFEDIPGHATVEMLNGQLGANPLTGEQADKLFKLVKAEPFELTRGAADIYDAAFWGPQDYVDEHLARIAESNQRVLQQAGDFLSPDQLNALRAMLSNGIDSRIKQAAALIPKH